MNDEWHRKHNVFIRKFMLIFTMLMLMVSPAMTMGSYEVYADENDNSSQSDVDMYEENNGDSNNDGGSNDNETLNDNDDGSNNNNEGNENEEDVDGNNENNENGEDSNENNEDANGNNEGNEEETEAVENDDEDEDELKFVTPVLPDITEATCDSAPKVIMNNSPAVDGVLYDLTGDVDLDDLKPGDTITIIAAPYDRYEDEGLVLDIPEGWTDVGDGFAIYEHTFAEPDCEDTDDEGAGDNNDGLENDEGADDVSVAAGKIINIDRDGCIVSITTQLEPGDYELQVWDDKVNISTVIKSVSEAGEYVFKWEIKNPAMEAAPGVAFALYEEGEEDSKAHFDYVDPYEYPREVANKCGGVTEEQPDGLGGPADPNDPGIFGEDRPADASNMEQGEPEVKTEEVTVKLEEEAEVVEVTQEGERLPNTATSLYNIMLYGIGVLLLGGVCLFIFRKRKV